MKNLFYKLSLVSFFALALLGCERDSETLSGGAPEYYQFTTRTTDFAVSDISNTATILFGVTTTSGSDRTIPVNVDASSTALPEQYSVPASIVIPAGKNIGELVVTGNFEALPEGQSYTLVLTVDEEEYRIMDEKNFHVLSLYKYCGTESLSGTHTYVQYNMFSPDVDITSSTITGEMTWVEGQTGVFSIPDLSWGQYAEAGYAAVASNGTAAVQWTCNGLVAIGRDQYNDVFTYDIISVEGPVLTFYWTNTYGDSGLVEVTREGGANWPDGLMP